MKEGKEQVRSLRQRPPKPSVKNPRCLQDFRSKPIWTGLKNIGPGQAAMTCAPPWQMRSTSSATMRPRPARNTPIGPPRGATGAATP